MIDDGSRDGGRPENCDEEGCELRTDRWRAVVASASN